MAVPHMTRECAREARTVGEQSEDSPSTRPDFDCALFDVSEYLAEARDAVHRGEKRRAQAFYTAAEKYAIRSGYLELLCLVWAYWDAVT